jgi:hypothetical protein
MNWRLQLLIEVSLTWCSRAACTMVVLDSRMSMTMRSFTSAGNAGGRPTPYHPFPEPDGREDHGVAWRSARTAQFGSSTHSMR